MCPSHAVAWKEAVSALGGGGGGEGPHQHRAPRRPRRRQLVSSRAPQGLPRPHPAGHPEGVGTLDFWRGRMEKMDQEGLPLLEGYEVTLQDVTYDEGMTLRPGGGRSASSTSRATPGARPSYTSPTPESSCLATTWSWTGRPCSTRRRAGLAGVPGLHRRDGRGGHRSGPRRTLRQGCRFAPAGGHHRVDGPGARVRRKGMTEAETRADVRYDRRWKSVPDAFHERYEILFDEGVGRLYHEVGGERSGMNPMTEQAGRYGARPLHVLDSRGEFLVGAGPLHPPRPRLEGYRELHRPVPPISFGISFVRLELR